MAEIIKRGWALSVNPLKASATIAASSCCTALGKVFFVRHFREPISLQTTAIDQGSAVMGANEELAEGLKILCTKNAPELIGVPTTGLVETQ